MPFYTKPQHRIFRLTSILLTAISILTCLKACNKYSVTLNDQSIYQPQPLFNDYQISDPHLHACVAQTISDKAITAAIQLQRLICTNAGIKDLVGLEVFSQLQELNFNDNALNNLKGIDRLSKLTRLSLKNNQLGHASELLLLQNLIYLDITRNPQLDCNNLQQLNNNQTQQTHTNKQKIEFYLPKQCR